MPSDQHPSPFVLNRLASRIPVEDWVTEHVDRCPDCQAFLRAEEARLPDWVAERPDTYQVPQARRGGGRGLVVVFLLLVLLGGGAAAAWYTGAADVLAPLISEWLAALQSS